MKTEYGIYLDSNCQRCKTNIGLELKKPLKSKKCVNCGELIEVSQEERDLLFKDQYTVKEVE